MSQVANYVLQATTGTGTSDLTLIAADTLTTPFNPIYAEGFAGAFGTGSGNKFYYGISHTTAHEREVGIGYMSDATTLVRETIISSTNANAAVDFTAGTKIVTCDMPSAFQTHLAGLSENIEDRFYREIFSNPSPWQEGWRVYSDDFNRGNVLADYNQINVSNGTSAAASISNISSLINGVPVYGTISLTTGTTDTGHGGLRPGVAAIPATGMTNGVKIRVSIINAYALNEPDASQDFVMLLAALTDETGATFLDTVATGVNIHFRSERTVTNWQFRYVDDAGVLQTVDTGVAAATETPKIFSYILEIGASAANDTVKAYINGVQVASVTGVQRSASHIFLWPGRIQKTAGTTARIMRIDGLQYGHFDPSTPALWPAP